MQRDTHDPQSTLDYPWDWSTWLQTGETITSHTVTVAGVGLNIDSHNVAGPLVIVWLSGGIADTSYLVTCHITTSAGRQDDRSRTINCRDR